MSKYIIIDAETIEKRIMELEIRIIPNHNNNNSEIDNFNLLFIAKQNELNNILKQSTPLMPEIEKAYNAGKLHNELSITFDNPQGRYISNLKLNI